MILCSSLCGRAGEDCVDVVGPIAWSRYYGRCVILCSSSCGRAGKDWVEAPEHGRCLICFSALLCQVFTCGTEAVCCYRDVKVVWDMPLVVC